jgi:hypothetical protein
MTISLDLLASPAAEPPPLGAGFARDLEHVELAVWRGVLRLATAGEISRHRLFVAETDGCTALGAGAIDILYFNRVIGLGIGQPATRSGVARLVERYRAAGVPRFFVHLAPVARPAALVRWLDEGGFVHHHNYAKLFRDARPAREVRTELRIEVIGPQRAAEFGSLAAEAFGWPPLMARLLARTVTAPGWRHYLAWDGREAVACAFRVLGRFAYFGPAATLPSHRGRGAQGALIARRIRDAAAAGCDWLVSETAEDPPERSAPSFRNLTRAGFRLAYLRPNYGRSFVDEAARGAPTPP